MNTLGIFQISADFELSKKPDWLDAFRAKYDLPYDFHITFKTTTYYNPEDLESLKSKMQEIVEKYKPLKIVFDELFIGPASSGWCIMIKAQHNEELLRFQKEVSETFAKYGENTSETKKGFEKNFEPHITIARHLDDANLEIAKSELGDDLICEAIIDSLTLSVAKEDTFDEWAKPENKIFYKIKPET